MRCETCEQDPCTCQKKLGKPSWIVTHCVTPGCGVAIRYRADQGLLTALCKWCQAGKAYYVRQSK